MESEFDLICLFGHSPLTLEICHFANRINKRCLCIYSSRQSALVDPLDFPSNVEKICIETLNSDKYASLKLNEHKSLGISFGSPYIFNLSNINDFKGHLINSHGAPLPCYKGGGGFSWRILNRDKRGSSLMHLVAEKIDEGSCIFRQDFVFDKSVRTPQQFEKVQLDHDRKYILPWLKEVIVGKIGIFDRNIPCPSSIDYESYFPRLCTDIHGYIDWSMNIQAIESFVLAFFPYPGAMTFINGNKVRIFDCRIKKHISFHPFMKGLIIEKGPDALSVCCVDGILEINYSDMIFDKEISSIKNGDRFYTSSQNLMDALKTRVYYKPGGLLVQTFPD